MLDPQNIKALRESLGETQAQFGDRFGVDQSTVHRWETAGLPNGGAARTAVERFAAEQPSSQAAE
jgi:DNA-binding transcriptional regulator YiaG